jgi:hypothetical protein
MERTPVNSSQIASVGYTGTTLEVEFRSGSVYRYDGVPAEVARDLRNAPSVGSYFGAKVKDCYHTTMLNPRTGTFEPLSSAAASQRSLEYLHGLAIKAGLCTGHDGELMSPAWTGLLTAMGRPYPGNIPVQLFLGTLLQSECSAAIESLKQRFAA